AIAASRIDGNELQQMIDSVQSNRRQLISSLCGYGSADLIVRRHCERSEAISKRFCLSALRDCFVAALLAMTVSSAFPQGADAPLTALQTGAIPELPPHAGWPPAPPRCHWAAAAASRHSRWRAGASAPRRPPPASAPRWWRARWTTPS